MKLLKTNMNMKNKMKMNGQAPKKLTLSGQATLEYLILFAVIAAITYLGMVNMRSIERGLDRYEDRATEIIFNLE